MTALYKEYTDAQATREQLKNALAMNRLLNLWTEMSSEAQSSVEHDEAKRIKDMVRKFERIHRAAFHDWNRQETAVDNNNMHELRSGEVIDSAKRIRMREIIRELVSGNGKSGLFDSNGFVVRLDEEGKTEKLAEKLADFYDDMRKLKPFAYGNEATLDFFMVMLGELPAFRAVYPGEIDFARRLDAEDMKNLHDEKSSHEQLVEAFNHALSPARTAHLDNSPSRQKHGEWDSAQTYIAEIPFLSHTVVRDGKEVECLVTVNGGLVRKDEVAPKVEAAIHAGKLLGEMEMFKPTEGYLENTDSLRRADKMSIDGIKVDGEAAPLFCLDMNIMTGLRSNSHDALVELMEEQKGKGVKLTELVNDKGLKEKLEAAAGNDAHMRKIIHVAYKRMSVVLEKMGVEKNKILEEAIGEGLTSVEKPKAMLVKGGPGSGKGSGSDLFAIQTQKNFITASLDELRDKSDLQKLLKAANHHSDDYQVVEPMANGLREMITKEAMAKKYNLLYDSTAVPYAPRYANLVKELKGEGYSVTVASIDTNLFERSDRNGEFPKPAKERVWERFAKAREIEEKRALPWIVVTGKHSRASASLLKVVEDANVDKLVSFANDGEQGTRYIVMESFDIKDKAEVNALKDAEHSGHLAEKLREMIRKKDDSTMRTLTGDKPDEEIKRIPAFEEGNVAALNYTVAGKERVLAIYNVHRAIDLLEKGMINPHAASPEVAYHAQEQLSWMVPDKPNEKSPDILQLHNPGESYAQKVLETRQKVKEGHRAA